MTRRTKIFIAVGLLLLVAIVLFWYLWKPAAPLPVVEIVPVSVVENRSDGVAQVIGTTEPSPESTALRTARFVIERFGTFSSDEGLIGVQELVAVSTPQMAQWLIGTYIPSATARIGEKSFYSESVRVLAVEMVKLTETNATVAVRAQRQVTDETVNTMQNVKFTIELVREEGSWLVSGVTEVRE